MSARESLFGPVTLGWLAQELARIDREPMPEYVSVPARRVLFDWNRLTPHARDDEGIDEADTLADIPALIARVREQEQEIARLRLDEHRLNWLDVHPRMVVVADRGEHGFQWAARDVDGACIWLGGLRQAIDCGREIEANVAAEADR